MAITDGRSGQAVVNLDNLRELVRLMEAKLTDRPDGAAGAERRHGK